MRTILMSALLFLTTSLHAMDKSYYETSGGAIRGYDTVAYFTQNKAIKGNKKYSHTWKHNRWYFSSAQHLALFKQTPEKYAPQYGGFCAFAAANDALVKTDPKAWTIIDDKLYLNYSLNVRKKWLKDPRDYIADANENWGRLSKKVADF